MEEEKSPFEEVMFILKVFFSITLLYTMLFTLFSVETIIEFTGMIGFFIIVFIVTLFLVWALRK